MSAPSADGCGASFPRNLGQLLGTRTCGMDMRPPVGFERCCDPGATVYNGSEVPGSSSSASGGSGSGSSERPWDGCIAYCATSRSLEAFQTCVWSDTALNSTRMVGAPSFFCQNATDADSSASSSSAAAGEAATALPVPGQEEQDLAPASTETSAPSDIPATSSSGSSVASTSPAVQSSSVVAAGAGTTSAPSSARRALGKNGDGKKRAMLSAAGVVLLLSGSALLAA